MPAPRPKELDSPIVPKVLTAMSHANVWLYRATNGFLGSKWRVGSAFPWGIPVCLVTTVGRKSGQPRTSPLLYVEDGANVIVVASKGGLPEHPLWYGNMQAHPDVTVQIGGRVRPMRARTATAAERAVLWPRLVAHYRDFENYQSWTRREIPVVICEPV